jgi:hypothetical protein
VRVSVGGRGIGVKVAVIGQNVNVGLGVAGTGVRVAAMTRVWVGSSRAVGVGGVTTVGKDWVGVGSRVEVGARRGTGVAVATGCVAGGIYDVGVTNGVGVSDTGTGAMLNAANPTQ